MKKRVNLLLPYKNLPAFHFCLRNERDKYNNTMRMYFVLKILEGTYPSSIKFSDYSTRYWTRFSLWQTYEFDKMEGPQSND